MLALGPQPGIWGPLGIFTSDAQNYRAWVVPGLPWALCQRPWLRDCAKLRSPARQVWGPLQLLDVL